MNSGIDTLSIRGSRQTLPANCPTPFIPDINPIDFKSPIIKFIIIV